MLQLRIFYKKVSFTEQIQLEVNGWIEKHPTIEILDREARIVHTSDEGDDDIFVTIWFDDHREDRQ